MIGESVAIVIVLLVACLMALRTGRRAMAKMTLPFFSVPLCFLLGEALFYSLRQRPEFPLPAQRVVAVLVGGIAGVISAVLIANRISKEISGAKRTYVLFAGVFVVLMVLTYCFRLMP